MTLSSKQLHELCELNEKVQKYCKSYDERARYARFLNLEPEYSGPAEIVKIMDGLHEAVTALRTYQEREKILVGALENIVRRRRTYEGLPCKNIEADIAQQALATIEHVKESPKTSQVQETCKEPLHKTTPEQLEVCAAAMYEKANESPFAKSWFETSEKTKEQQMKKATVCLEAAGIEIDKGEG